MLQQVAQWNKTRDVWETGEMDLFSGHLDVFSETFPKSGTTRNGVLFLRPMLEHRTAGNESSSSPGLLRTPCAAEAEGGMLHPDKAKRQGQTLRLSSQIVHMVAPDQLKDDLLPTPAANLATSGPDYARAGRDGSGGNDLITAISLLPTPTVNDMGASYTPDEWDAWTAKMKAAHGNGNGHGKSLSIEAQRLLPTPTASLSGNTPEEHLRKKPGRERVTDLSILVENDLLATGGKLLPTPRASDGEKGGPNQRGSKGDLTVSSAVHLLPTPKAGDADFGLPRTSGHPPERSTHLATRLHYTDFGQYAPAIERWEAVTGRKAPAPTAVNAKGKHQLSARFVEWMMGLTAGWVTDFDIGLSRSQQLKALGNGVVPQQAAFAVSGLLARSEIKI